MNDVGIVIVTYNSGEEIGACLDAALPSGAEIVVVDNASSDKTVAEIERRKVRLIRNADNLGFATAVNQGFRALSASYVVLLNPDANLATGLGDLRRQCDLLVWELRGAEHLARMESRRLAGWLAVCLLQPLCASKC